MIRHTCLALAALSLPGSAAAAPVFLRLKAPLDTPTHFCMDLVGHGASVSLTAPIQGHSCKEGAPQEDQQLDSERGEAGELYLSHYDRCLAPDRLEVGAAVSPQACDGTQVPTWVWETDGALKPAKNSSLCLTLGPGPSVVAGSPPGIVWLHRPMDLQACAPASTDRQQWALTPARLPIRPYPIQP